MSAAAVQTKPFFRADHVGSLLRPPEVFAAREAFERAEHFLLEYDDDRSGDFEPLRFMPTDKRVVLGLVTSKRGTPEDQWAKLRLVVDTAREIWG